MEEKKYLSRDSSGKMRLYIQNEHIEFVVKNQGNFQTVSESKFKITGTEKNIHNELVAFTGFVIISVVFNDKPTEKPKPMKWNRDGKALIDASNYNKSQFDLVIKEPVTT